MMATVLSDIAASAAARSLIGTLRKSATLGSNKRVLSRLARRGYGGERSAVEACLGGDDPVSAAAIRGARTSGQLAGALVGFRAAIGEHPLEACYCRQRFAYCTIVSWKNAGPQFNSLVDCSARCPR